MDNELPEGENRRRGAINALNLTIATLILNLIGATAFWIQLPEKIKALIARSDELSLKISDHEERIRRIDQTLSRQEATLERIDERTKSIQDTVLEIKRGK